MPISRPTHSFIHSVTHHRSTILISGLLGLLYVPLLIHWVDGWLNKSISTEHEYFSHGLLGLPFAAYLAWQNRERWQQLSDSELSLEPSLESGLGSGSNLGLAQIAGLALLLVGLGCYASRLTDGINLSLVVILAGLCLWFKGLPGLRLQGFALLLVLLATPNQIPYLIAPYTLPLQQFIAAMAGFILAQSGIAVRVDQIYLFVNDRIVEVAPYCAGLKMLFTSLYVGLLLLYWTDAWRSRAKVLWFYSGLIAISVTANVIRNALLAYFHGTGQEQAFYWLHDSWGGDLYSTAMLGIIALLLQGIDRWISAADFEADADFDDDFETDPGTDLSTDSDEMGTEHPDLNPSFESGLEP
jgi:cyanoexosortase B